jgi:cytochrome c5
MNRGSRVWRERSWWLSLALTALAACGGGAGGGSAQQAAAGAAADTAQAGATGVNDRLILASAKTALPPPGVAAADLPDPNSEGAKAVAQFCITCHNLPSPTIHSATDWPSVMRRMWLRMDLLPEGLRVPVPTEEQRQAILNYLLGHALQVSGTNLPEGPGRSTFSKMCSRCHALPDPRQHSTADWPAVVTRMEQRMDQMKVDRPGQGQVSEIILYLQAASSKRR